MENFMYLPCSYAWKILELGLKVYDQAHGHLKGQKLIFGLKRGYQISHNLEHYYHPHEYRSFGWSLATSLLHCKLLGLESYRA
jgi:hypothetical protein